MTEEENKNEADNSMPNMDDELPDLEDMELPDFDDPDQQTLMPEPDEHPSFWKRYQEVIVTVVILIAIAAGFYLYARNSNQEEGKEVADEASQEKTSPIDELEFEEITDTDNSATELRTDKIAGANAQADNTAPSDTIEPTPTNEPSTNQEVAQEKPTSPPVEVSDDAITVSAQAGEGVTHLARRALAEYLKNNSVELTNEHKIYIEDYLKDMTKSDGLAIGESVSFGSDLITEAITASQNLTDSQLQNLQKYSKLVFG